jgi:hypothetical protein
MAFPRYALITDAATGTANFSSRLGAILTQVDKNGNHYAISFASRQLKDHEKNYSPFLLEAAAAVWGMEVINEYLRGKQFILFTDHKPLEKLGHLHTKTLNRLQTALWSMISSFNTKKELTYHLITYHGCHPCLLTPWTYQT